MIEEIPVDFEKNLKAKGSYPILSCVTQLNKKVTSFTYQDLPFSDTAHMLKPLQPETLPE